MVSSFHNSLAPKLRWIWLLGGIGFVAGYLGPIVLNPDANQGPLVGIFISGPIGVALGLVFFVLSSALKITVRRQWQILTASAAALALTTLYCVLPEPALRGHLLDVRVTACAAPRTRTKEIIRGWEERVGKVTWAAPRAGWQEDMRRALRSDTGLVLQATVVRTNQVQIRRKPWNKGKMLVLGWKKADERRWFYLPAADGSCADHPVGAKARYFRPYDASAASRAPVDWPPKQVADFIDLQTLGPVPPDLRSVK